METRKQRIKKTTLQTPYLYSFLGLSLGFLILNSYLNKVHITLPALFQNYKISIPFILLNIAVAILVATNINLAVYRFKEYKNINKSSGLTAAGLAAAFIGGACPSCLVGVFPALLGTFGVAGTSLSILPFYGLEIQVFSILLLTIGLIFLTKDNTCKIKRKRRRD